jgi:ferredoxin--NADP+ reductase
VPHQAARILRDGVPSPGVYVAGWIKPGPTGVIGTNRLCAKETVTSLLADAAELSARPVRRRTAGDAA